MTKCCHLLFVKMYNKLIVIFFLKTIIIRAENIDHSFQFDINGTRSIKHEVQQNFTMSNKNVSLIQNVTLGASDNFTKANIYENYKPLPPVVLGDFYLVIPCNAIGNPKPEIKWIRNNDVIIIDNSNYLLNTDGSLQINHPTSSTNGIYFCLAKNIHTDHWIESSMRKIMVRPAPVFLRPVLNITLRDGESRDIQCPLLNSKNITSQDYLRWYKDNKLYAEGSLKLNSVNYLNRGVYICRISYWNRIESETAAVRITMNEGKPVFIRDYEHSLRKKSQRVILDCLAYGSPTPTIQWMHNGILLNNQKFSHIFHLNSQSSGFYECIVQNALGSITKSFEVKVNLD